MPIAKEVKKHSNSSNLINSSTKLPTTINIRNISRIYFKKKPFSFDTGYPQSNNTLYPDLNNDATKDEQKLTNNLSNNNNQKMNIRPLVTRKKLPKGKYFNARKKTLEMLKNRQSNIRKKPIITKKHKELEIPTMINQPDDNVYVANRLIILKRFFERQRFSLNNTKKGHTSNKFAHPLLTSNRRIILPRRYNLL
uniref:Ribosomal protein S18 n=1 Tax=Acrobeloides nanus TaxID=290746 RepID=A0A914BV90_9BILA